MKDIAERSGVSVATVSLSLNGKGNISREVRARIAAVAEELGYLKNIHASSMAGQKSYHIAVLVPERDEKSFDWYLMRNIMISVEETITTEHYYPILLPVDYQQKSREIVEKVVRSGAGAVFSINFGTREHFRQLEDRGIPVVLLNESRYAQEFHSVTADALYGAYEATRHALAAENPRLIYVDYRRPKATGIVYDRRAGFEKAVNDATDDVDTEFLTIENLDDNTLVEETAERIGAMVESRSLSVVAHDDFLAAMLYAHWSRMGIRVPEQISIVSPGDTLNYTIPFIPQITTLRSDTELMGTLGGQMMMRRLSGKSTRIENLKVQHIFADRGSCRAPT